VGLGVRVWIIGWIGCCVQECVCACACMGVRMCQVLNALRWQCLCVCPGGASIYIHTLLYICT